jgi:hypothetical protein
LSPQCRSDQAKFNAPAIRKLSWPGGFNESDIVKSNEVIPSHLAVILRPGENGAALLVTELGFAPNFKTFPFAI